MIDVEKMEKLVTNLRLTREALADAGQVKLMAQEACDAAEDAHAKAKQAIHRHILELSKSNPSEPQSSGLDPFVELK